MSTFSIRKVTTPEQATFLGVNVGETVFVAPISDLVPLIKEAEAPAPSANKTELSANEKKILGVLKSMGNNGLGRGEVLDKAKMSPSEWSTAISALKDAGLVKQTGDRRSAKYYVVGEPSIESNDEKTSPELEAALDLAKRALAGEDVTKEVKAPVPTPEMAPPLGLDEVDEAIDEIPDEVTEEPQDSAPQPNAEDKETTDKAISAAFEVLGKDASAPSTDW